MANKTAKCTCCNNVFYTVDMVQTEMPNRGNRNAYMCVACATRNRNYHTNNNVLQGKAKANMVGAGIELETSYSNEYARNIMFEYGFIPTHDGSLSSDGAGSRYGDWDGNACEYVSGIMQGLNKASKFCDTLQTLIDNNHVRINESCGTHFHVSVNAMKNGNGEQVYIGYIQRFYHSLFTPLCNAMKANPEKTTAMFGRYFSNWAKTVHADSYCGDRYNFINVTNDSNIEFRLNKFVNAKQYQNLMKMEVEMVQAIVKNFCEHFNDEPKDNRRYANKTEYRKHKANVTAGKLVKIFEKYSANI